MAVELGHLPLALAQAAAVIADQHLGYGTYLDRLRGMPVDKLLRPVEAGQYPHGVAAAVLLSLEGVRAGDDTGVCITIMELLAVLSPAGIRRALVYAAARQGVPDSDGQAGELAPEAVDRALARLARASLLTFSVDGSNVSAHRLIMRVIREQLAAENSLKAVCTAAAQLLDGLAVPLTKTSHQDRAAARDLVEQIMALYESSAGCRADSALVNSMMPLRGWAVAFLNRLGDSTVRSISIAEPLLAEMEQVLGVDHPYTMATRNNLAFAYQEVGRATEAISLYEQTLADQERVLGADHPFTLLSRNNLATAYREVGRAADAITLLEHTLADRERVLGANHPDTLRSQNDLAFAYRAAGRAAEAITLHKQTLADQERIMGSDHPATQSTRNDLAVAYHKAGRAAEAISLYERTLADRKQMLGADHPYTLRSRNNLATAYREVGRAADAITLLEHTLADRERVLGANHPDTLDTRNDLAVAYQKAGRAADATTLHERTMADQERILGVDHPDTLRSRNNLATAYLEVGRVAEAITLLEQNVAEAERVLGIDHPDTLIIRNNLATAHGAGQVNALRQQNRAAGGS